MAENVAREMTLDELIKAKGALVVETANEAAETAEALAARRTEAKFIGR